MLVLRDMGEPQLMDQLYNHLRAYGSQHTYNSLSYLS